MNAQEIAKKYQVLIGLCDERVSFLHTDPAIEAAALLAQAPAAYVDITVHNFVYRVGQVLGDAKYFVAIRHEAAGVYSFMPTQLA